MLGWGMAGYLEQSLEKIKEFEGVIPWMYLDTVGKVTVGVGLLLANEAAAHALPFSAAGRAATADEIGREFARVSAMKQGRAADFYESVPSLQLSTEIIDDRLRATIEGFEGYLRSHMPGYDLLPDPAKLALLDMIYNLGPGRLFAEYSRLLAAIERGDWKTAAAASLRRRPSPARNAWARQQFLSAATIAAATIGEIKAEAKQDMGGVLLGLLSGLAAAAAIAIMAGGLDRLAGRASARRLH